MGQCVFVRGRTAGVYNPQSNAGSDGGLGYGADQKIIKHGDITAAAAATFTSTNANSWLIGEHPRRWDMAYLMVEEVEQGGHNCWGNARSGDRKGHGADKKTIMGILLLLRWRCQTANANYWSNSKHPCPLGGVNLAVKDVRSRWENPNTASSWELMVMEDGKRRKIPPSGPQSNRKVRGKGY